MAFAALIIGVVLLISAARNTTSQLFSLVAGDFTGTNNFIFWAFSIMVVGATGYIPKFKPLSVAFITLAIIVLVLKRGNPNGTGGGFFEQLITQLNSTQTAKYSSTSSTSSSLGGVLGGLLGGLGGGLNSSSPSGSITATNPFGTNTGSTATTGTTVGVDAGSNPDPGILTLPGL